MYTTQNNTVIILQAMYLNLKFALEKLCSNHSIQVKKMCNFSYVVIIIKNVWRSQMLSFQPLVPENKVHRDCLN